MKIRWTAFIREEAQPTTAYPADAIPKTVRIRGQDNPTQPTQHKTSASFILASLQLHCTFLRCLSRRPPQPKEAQ